MNRSKVFLGAGRYLLVGLASVIAMVPVFWMATMAFKPREEWTSGIDQLSWLPKDPTFDNFTFIFTGHAPKLFVAIDRVAIGPAISVWCARLSEQSSPSSWVRCRVWGFPFQGRPEFATVYLQMRLLPPLAVMIPVMTMWAFSTSRHVVGIVAHLRHRHPAVRFLADDDFFRRHAKRDRRGGSRRRMHALGCVPAGNPADGEGALGDDHLFVFILNWSDYAIACCLRGKTGSIRFL